jgi:uncharacterized LabA/DUF88 family protein
MDRSLCRIGTFYDGSYFTYAQNHFNHTRGLGWLAVQAFQELIQNFVAEHEPAFASHRVVYSAWFQGLFNGRQADDRQLYHSRLRDQDLMHAGIEAKYVPMSQANEEKGVDVWLAIEALQVALEGKIDVAALVTGDGDFVPLVRSLMKHGVRAAVFHFDYHVGPENGFANERLLRACNYALNVNALENDESRKGAFQALFPPCRSKAVQGSREAQKGA